MAEEVAININVTGNTDKAVNSLQNLQKELKKAKSEALNGDGKAAERVAELQEKMDNLRDSVGTLKGSGIERTENSFRLLGEGFKTLDMEKIKVGFKGIGAAMNAIPLMLIVQGFEMLVEHFDEIVEWFKELIGSTNKFTRELEELKKANEDVIKSIDAQITALSGLKANEKEIIELNRTKIKLKIEEGKVALQAAILNQKNAEGEMSTMDKLISLMGNQTAVEVRRQAEITKAREETKKATQELEAQLASLQGFENVQTQKTIDDNKKKSESYKKLQDEKLKIAQDEEKAFWEGEKRREAQHQAELARLQKEADDKLQIKINSREAEQNLILQGLADVEADTEKRKRLLESLLQAEMQVQAAKFQLAEAGVQIAQQIFQKNKRVADALFLLEKAIAITKIIVNLQGEIAGYKLAYAAIPGGAAISTPLAIAARIRAAAGIATIVGTSISKFMNGGGGLPSSGGGGGGGQVPTGQAPVIQTPTNSNSNIDPLTGQVKNNQQQSQKVYVLETDITKKVKTIATIKETATF